MTYLPPGFIPGVDDVHATLQFKDIYNIGPHETRPARPDNYDNLESPLEKMRYDVLEPNVWPDTGNCTFDTGFRETLQAGFKIRRNIGRAFVKSIARALKMPALPELFLEDQYSSMGLRRYLARAA